MLDGLCSILSCFLSFFAIFIPMLEVLKNYFYPTFLYPFMGSLVDTGGIATTVLN